MGQAGHRVGELPARPDLFPDPSPALSAGAIAGIVLGVLAAVALPLLFYYCYRKPRR